MEIRVKVEPETDFENALERDKFEGFFVEFSARIFLDFLVFNNIFPSKNDVKIWHKNKYKPKTVSFQSLAPTQPTRKPSPAFELRIIPLENSSLSPPFFLKSSLIILGPFTNPQIEQRMISKKYFLQLPNSLNRELSCNGKKSEKADE